MSEPESPRLIALKETVELCLRSGMPESEVVRLVQAEVFGAAKLRAAIQERLVPPKPIKMNYYQYAVDKKITSEDILAAVNQAVGGVKI